MDTEKNILEGASNLFMQFGLKSVTMDDIASKVGVSKKTIYQFYKDKGEIIQNSLKKHFEEHKKTILSAVEGSDTALDAIFQISKCMKSQVESVNPVVMYDLQKYYPRAYHQVLEFKQKFMLELLKEILNKGIKEGLFRPEIDVQILAIVRIEQVQAAFNTSIFPRDKFDFFKVNIQMFDHFVHGIITEKGREKYNYYMNHEYKF
ncbi:TetR/AcrR family transcriptional regulator [Marivirga aurantiaca]|uniref:TetR/AcrR family transcriptional regulator n=1 Tax=Marivirga aurantiaca TaxID=2802615 RepID=UPI001917832D|nr:TetR/AcrR family transcriptional regulator [Marivirga aurantiaca]